ncbi:terminase TerL endonuclease subunit [uncultured Alsobacter sp.]|uniref:terminase large subunit n=1 Tax=uncultured Alsobacter sp. TaxID=1748258 RepID=UPI0025FDC6CF|nr:terminase TerL endonuclease subunit [uncultured Alsobacter sp.]
MARPKRKIAVESYSHPLRRDYADLPNIFVEIDGEAQPFVDYPTIARDYAERVVDGRVIACRYVVLAAERYLRFLKRAEKKDNAFRFSIEHVCDVCSFLENLPHVEGEWNEPLIVLEPWQIFMLAAIFGFIRKDGSRLCRWVYFEIPRKSAKSTLLAGIALYVLTCSGEVGPSIYIGAPTLEQAGKVFSPASKMVQKDQELQEAFGLRPRARKIFSDVTLGAIEMITSVGEHQDGHNPSMVILEELHAQKADLYEVMRSSFGARKNPLLFQITTAGRVASGICWDQRKRMIRILEGLETADEVFGAIYTVDKDDEGGKDKKDYTACFTERVMIKANPMWGVSVDPTKAFEFANEAKGSIRLRAEFLRTRLNVWSNAAERLIQTEDWDACLDPRLRLEDYRGRDAYIGVDLASRRDMAAKVVIIEDGEYLIVFASFYIPSDCAAFGDPDVGSLYKAWVDDYHVFTTGPGMIDFDMIEEDIREDCRFFNVKAIALDPFQAQQLAQNLAKRNLPALLFPNTARNMTEPTDDLVSRVETGLLRHDGNPVLAWHASNTVGYEDQKGNTLPKKDAPNSIYKIDGIAAAVFANGCRLQAKEPDKKKPKLDVYSKRGVHGASSET